MNPVPLRRVRWIGTFSQRSTFARGRPFMRSNGVSVPLGRQDRMDKNQFESRPVARDQIVRLCTNPMLLGEEIIMAETTYNPARSHRAAIDDRNQLLNALIVKMNLKLKPAEIFARPPMSR